jgi:hypothetical protein
LAEAIFSRNIQHPVLFQVLAVVSRAVGTYVTQHLRRGFFPHGDGAMNQVLQVEGMQGLHHAENIPGVISFKLSCTVACTAEESSWEDLADWLFWALVEIWNNIRNKPSTVRSVSWWDCLLAGQSLPDCDYATAHRGHSRTGVHVRGQQGNANPIVMPAEALLAESVWRISPAGPKPGNRAWDAFRHSPLHQV